MDRRTFFKLEAGTAGVTMLLIAFGVIALASIAYIATGTHIQTPSATGSKLQEEVDTPYDAPQFTGITAWLNSPPLTMKELRGKVVLVDFWTYACINCVRTLPYLTEWDRKYRSLGLVIVGVHSPEFEFEKKPDNVRAAIAQHGIRYPVALDNQLDTWRSFDNHSWPAHYLIDRDGKVVHTHFGEGGYDATENNIRRLLGLNEGVAQLTPVELSYASERKHQQRLKSFKDCTTCASMVVIPAGSFDMGAQPNTHRVTIAHSFALGKYEVTQAEWQAVMGNNPSHLKGPNLPVENVNWNDVQEFIQKLNQKTGLHYRLPTEAEWEYACKAGEPKEYCGGNDNVAWYGAHGEPGGNSGMTTHPVGAKQANAWGLHDMSGNVWEWTEDSWHGNYDGAPTDGSAWPGDGAKRVIRGGSWLDYPLLARADVRVWAGVGKRSSDLGFRLARTM